MLGSEEEMEEKFEKKYGNALNRDQKSLLQLYCEGNEQKLQVLIEKLTSNASVLVDRYAKNTTDKFLVEKVINIINLMGGRVLTPDETRKKLSLIKN